jgi:hypothetical protein
MVRSTGNGPTDGFRLLFGRGGAIARTIVGLTMGGAPFRFRPLRTAAPWLPEFSVRALSLFHDGNLTTVHRRALDRGFKAGVGL